MSTYLKGWSVWHRGLQVIDAMEYHAPDLSIRMEEYFAGHMDGPRINDNGMDPLTASLKIRGANVGDFISIGSRPFLNPRFVIREGYATSRGGVIGIEDEIEGFISKVSQDAISEAGRAGKSTTIDISLSYYKRSVRGVEKVLLIPGEGVRRINGVDTLNVVSVMVYLSSLSSGISDIDFTKLNISDFIGGGF